LSVSLNCFWAWHMRSALT